MRAAVAVAGAGVARHEDEVHAGRSHMGAVQIELLVRPGGKDTPVARPILRAMPRRGWADVAFPLWPIPSDKTADGHSQSRAYSHSKRFGVQGVRTRGSKYRDLRR